MIDWSQCPAVESDPEKLGGAWVFRGTRVPVAGIFDNLQDSSLDEVLEDFPSVTRDQIEAALAYIAEQTRQAPPQAA